MKPKLQAFKLFMLTIPTVVAMSTISYAQTPFKEEITIIAPYEPTIRDAIKINIQPRIEAEEVEIPPAEISITPRKINVTSNVEPIQAVNPPNEKMQPLFRNLLRAGFGNYKTPYIEFTANSLRQQQYMFGLHLKHLSGSSQLKPYAFSGYSDNTVRMTAQRFFSQWALSADANYERQVIHHYGFVTDSFPQPIYNFTDEDIRQRFNKAGAKVKAESFNQETGVFRFGTKVGYSFINDLYSLAEHNVTGSAGISFPLNLVSSFDDQQGQIGFDVHHSSTRDSLTTFTNTLYRFKPEYHIAFQEYKMKAGFTLAIDHDTSNHWHFFPFAEATLTLIDRRLLLTAGIDGGIEKNSFNRLSEINPYLQSVLTYRNQSVSYRFYARINSNIASLVDINAFLSYESGKNAPFFVNDTIVPFNRFLVVYDSQKLLSGGLKTHFKTGDNWVLGGEVRFYKYKLENEVHPWHKPSFDATLYGSVKINPKLSVSTSLFTQGKTWAKVWNGQSFDEKIIKSWVDVNLGAKYQFSEQFHCFINARNLTAGRYYYWYNYPSQRLNIIAGVGFSF